MKKSNVYPVQTSDEKLDRRIWQANLQGAVTAMAKLASCIDHGGLSMASIASALAQEACALETKLVDVRRASVLVNKLDKAEY